MRVLDGAKLSVLIGLSAGSLWISKPSLAAPGTPIGPPGGAMRSLVVDPGDPRILYAGPIAGGVYKSVDGGGSWKPASRGLYDHRITALVIDATARASSMPPARMASCAARTVA